MDEPTVPETHKAQIVRRLSIVYVVLGTFFILLIGLAGISFFGIIAIPLMVDLYPYLVYCFLESIRTKSWKPTTLCVTLTISIFMYAHWYLGCGALHGALFNSLLSLFKNDFNRATSVQQWLGNIWLVYIFITVYEVFAKENKPYGLVFKVYSLILFSTYLYLFFAIGNHPVPRID